MIALLTTALGGVLVAGPDANAALRWTAPPDCPSRAQVGVWLQEAGGDAVSTTTEVEIRQPAPDRWVVRIAMRDDENATRTIEGETCEAVTRAAVVALALAGGEQAQAAARGPDDAAPRPTIAATDPPGQRSAAAAAFDPADTMPQEERMPTRAIDDPEPRVRATGVRARLSASGRVGYGFLPATAGGLALGIGVEGRRWWADVEARHWFRGFAPLPEHPEAGADVSLTTSMLAAGPLLWLGRVLVVPLGAGMQLGAQQARPRGAASARTAAAPWVAMALRAGLHWRPSPWWSAGIEVEAVAPLVRRTYVLDDVVIHRTRPVGVEAGVVTRFVFPREDRRTRTRLARQRPTFSARGS